VYAILPGHRIIVGDMTIIGYTRDDNKFLDLCKNNPNRYMITHRDIKNIDLPFETCFYGHTHSHYQVGKHISLSALFTSSWAEENEFHGYTIIDKGVVQYVPIHDLNILSFDSIQDIPDDKYDAIRFCLKLKASEFAGINKKAIEKQFIKTKVFWKEEVVKENFTTNKAMPIQDIVDLYLKDKNLTQEELAYGRQIFEVIQ
jgi:hypothetical protein